MIIAVGCIRAVLTLNGVPNDLTRLASMTVVILAASVYFSGRPTRPRERLLISYGLIAPYMLIEAIGLGYSWRTGTDTIFQTWPYNLGTPVHVHFWGHVVGGLTWEPLLVYGLITGLKRLRDRGR